MPSLRSILGILDTSSRGYNIPSQIRCQAYNSIYGISELDLRPQYAVIELRSFYEIKKYCELGANPDCEFPEHGSPIEYVDSDIAALYVDVRGRLKRQQKECFDIYDIVDLTWLARHQQNYDLLLSYIS